VAYHPVFVFDIGIRLTQPIPANPAQNRKRSQVFPTNDASSISHSMEPFGCSSQTTMTALIPENFSTEV
jgi:hypothetical protein